MSSKFQRYDEKVAPTRGYYRVIIDYGAYEGMKFLNDDVYPSVDAAVKAALAANSCSPFLIVRVIDWKAVE